MATWPRDHVAAWRLVWRIVTVKKRDAEPVEAFWQRKRGIIRAMLNKNQRWSELQTIGAVRWIEHLERHKLAPAYRLLHFCDHHGLQNRREQRPAVLRGHGGSTESRKHVGKPYRWFNRLLNEMTYCNVERDRKLTLERASTLHALIVLNR